MTDALRKSFAGRLSSLALAETLEALDRFGETIRPPVSQRPQGDVGVLPRISLGAEEGDRSASDPSDESAPDLSLKELLGAGGMGAVHLAWQRSLGRHVAVKVLREGESEAGASALIHEARVMGMLEHPAIIPVHAVGTFEDARPVIVMKRVEGASWLEALTDPEHPLIRDVRRGDDLLLFHLEILRRVCDAVSFAHRAGIVHRDLKPENVMLGGYGEVYLVDWGIAAKVGDHATGALVGTPAYLAPEMIEEGVLDARTDVYLLGAVLHEVLTGKLKHDGRTMEQVLLAAFLSAPYEYGDDVPKELAELCNQATSRDPDDRPASAEEFRRQLVEFERHQASVALARASKERLEELLSLIESAPAQQPLPSAALQDVYRLGSECRFGYRQALRDWPENEEAQGGSRRCVRLLAEVELRQGNVDAAQALAAELPEPDAELSERIRDAEAKREQDRGERTRLEQIAFDRDPAVASSVRRKLLLVLFVGGTAVSVYAQSQSDAGGLTAGRLLVVGLGFFAVMSAVVIAFRRRLMQNAFNRALAGVLVAPFALILVSRWLGYVQGLAVHEIFARDLLLCAAALLVGSFSLFRWLAILSAVTLTGAIVASMVPAQATMSFTVTGAVCLLLPLVMLWRTPGEAKPPASSPDA